MEILEEAIKYFKTNNGYNRLFKEMKEKYISLGEIRGNVVINKPTIDEKQALSGLMKKDYSKNVSISINLKKLQQRLEESKFEGIELSNLLKEYFKEEILTKKEDIKKKNDELEFFLQEILNENKNTYIYKFLEKSIEKRDSLYQNIKRYHKKDKLVIKNELLNACKGINNLPKVVYDASVEGCTDEPLLTRIPVFASKITSNPHGLDKNTLCGRLFILLLCYINEDDYPSNSEELAQLYYKNYLLIDDVSNMVLCKNIIGYTAEEENIEDEIKTMSFKIHKGLEGFSKLNEPIYLTLYNLSNLSYIDKNNKYKKVVITENPTVFMEVMQKCKVKDFPMICTYGQVKLAGIILMDLLVKQNYKLFYSGDLDPEGIQIADRLKQRYKDSLNLLGFTKDVYYKNISNVEINNTRLQKLDSIKSKEMLELCDEIRKNKKVSYEEENIDFIVEFIEKMNF